MISKISVYFSLFQDINTKWELYVEASKQTKQSFLPVPLFYLRPTTYPLRQNWLYLAGVVIIRAMVLPQPLVIGEVLWKTVVKRRNNNHSPQQQHNSINPNQRPIWH